MVFGKESSRSPEREGEMKAYRIATDEEKSARGVSEDYDLLIGPGKFECFLGEPEDRSWSRDANAVMVELNRLYELYEANHG